MATESHIVSLLRPVDLGKSGRYSLLGANRVRPLRHGRVTYSCFPSHLIIKSFSFGEDSISAIVDWDGEFRVANEIERKQFLEMRTTGIFFLCVDFDFYATKEELLDVVRFQLDNS